MEDLHAQPDPAKPGRPSLYTPELAARICERLADGESLRAICRDEAMPGRSTVMRWLVENEAFRDLYAQARVLQADAVAEDTIDIADFGANDTYTDSDGNKRTDYDVIQRSKLRVDARKWYASKLNPRKYGDKLQHTGEGGDGPITVVIRKFSDSEAGGQGADG